MAGDSSEELVVSLNMDNPYVKSLWEFVQLAPPEIVNAYFARMMRRQEFDSAMEMIGGLTKYRRKMVARALVRMFRAGYRCGSRPVKSEATDGR